MSPIACFMNDEGRAAGRGGTGAVMGSKKLKAITVRGRKKIEVAAPEILNMIVSEIIKGMSTADFYKWFKKWGTSCFGLPEVRKLLKILYCSMDAVSPRNVPNLEVNAPLGDVFKQMADKQAPPPMMYDFHLASMLPVVFNIKDARPLLDSDQLEAMNGA